MRPIVVFLILNSLPPFAISGVTYDFDSRLYQSYLQGNMANWEKIIADMEEEYKRTDDIQTLFAITHAQYGYIGYLLGSKMDAKGVLFLSRAEANVTTLLQQNPQWVEAMALRAALLAFRVSLNPLKAPFLGPEGYKLLNRALMAEPENPIVLIEKGNAKHYAPSIVGGNPEEATKLYRQAAKRLKAINNGVAPKTWWYLNTLVQLAFSAEKSGQPTLARKTYEEILATAPDFKWVRDDLYPKLLEKLK